MTSAAEYLGAYDASPAAAQRPPGAGSSSLDHRARSEPEVSNGGSTTPPRRRDGCPAVAKRALHRQTRPSTLASRPPFAQISRQRLGWHR